ncbi:MAG: hypothetical protein AB7P69_27945 [Candidatus Binatia bacterium]
MRKDWMRGSGIAYALAGFVSLIPVAGSAQESEALLSEVVTEQIAPDSQAELSAPAPHLSPQEHEAMLLRKLERREQAAAQYPSEVEGPPGLPLEVGRPTTIGSAKTEFPPNPQNLVIGRNRKNTNANGANGSTLAEPAAANNALHVFAAGNFNHAEFSTNGGTTWANVALPGGPADAPNICCDHDVVIDDARRVFFHSTLYVNTAVTNGVVRIFVRRAPPAAACSYTIDPAGTANNIVPDYPHLGLTKRFLYLTINALPTSGTGFARIYRFNIDQMTDCVTATTNTFTRSHSAGQRVWVPAEGTNNIETMYWVHHDSTTVMRIYRWSEAAAAPTQVTRTLTASSFTNPDCRGGTGNFDFIERPTAFQITGFRHRCTAAPGANGGPGALACYWNVGTDTAHTQGHVHAAVFNLSGLGLIAQPHIFSQNFCYGFPVVTANKRGDIGLSIAAGGKKGGGGNAARGFVGLDDEFTSGIGFFGTVRLTASGTHNRSDSRYGDYFTIHPYEPCEKWFTATNYALLNGMAVANVNSRYIEFGRNQSIRCYRSHWNHVPTYSPQ